MILSQFINGMRSSSKKSRLGITNVLQGNTVDEKILHQLISSLFPVFTRFYTSQVVVSDFFHQQNVQWKKDLGWEFTCFPSPTILAQRKNPIEETSFTDFTRPFASHHSESISEDFQPLQATKTQQAILHQIWIQPKGEFVLTIISSF